ncbi:MAG: hypothetical protein JNL11_08825 [Bdellovibrionaceae bacterium]|nr:hypothetical protein [Pseudobdellovibrionaceae bacterium]
MQNCLYAAVILMILITVASLKSTSRELQKTPITEENKFLFSRLALRVQSVLEPTEFITNKKIRRLLHPDE